MKISDLQKLGAVREVQKKEAIIVCCKCKNQDECNGYSCYSHEEVAYNTCHKLFSEAEVDLGKGLDINELAILIYRSWCNVPDYVARETWTSEHIQNVEKTMSGKIANALIKEINNCFKDK